MWIRFVRILIFSLVLSAFTGCANFGYRMKSFLGGGTPPPTSQGEEQKFSEQSTAGYEIKREYRRMTAARLEEEAKLGSGAGSLWVMEGQGSYLASENVVRVIGDIVNVKIDGAPKRQLSTKADVITKLLRRLQGPRAARKLAASGTPAGDKKEAAKNENVKKPEDSKSAPNVDGAAGAAAQGAEPEEDEEIKDAAFEVDLVPTRIVERMLDGNYRIKGSQSFMIGKKEYRVIVTGIARSQDLSDEGIDSSRLLDPQFDIVSKKGL